MPIDLSKWKGKTLDSETLAEVAACRKSNIMINTFMLARDYDLVIGADGVNSVTRSRHEAHFNPRIDTRQCRFIWLGTRKKLDAFTFAFKETPWGWFNLHAYRFNDEMSTFIVETPESTWLKAGLDQLETPASIAFCENLFADLLDGHPLISNAKHLRGSAVWLKFNRVLCERWYKDNIVLLGDAAHTAHFSIGSGTKLAMEDAISLVNVLNSSELSATRSVNVTLTGAKINDVVTLMMDGVKVGSAVVASTGQTSLMVTLDSGASWGGDGERALRASIQRGSGTAVTSDVRMVEVAAAGSHWSTGSKIIWFDPDTIVQNSGTSVLTWSASASPIRRPCS